MQGFCLCVCLFGFFLYFSYTYEYLVFQNKDMLCYVMLLPRCPPFNGDRSLVYSSLLVLIHHFNGVELKLFVWPVYCCVRPVYCCVQVILNCTHLEGRCHFVVMASGYFYNLNHYISPFLFYIYKTSVDLTTCLLLCFGYL